jgi:hypothetical protein
MRRRAVTVVATQEISPVMAMLVALVIALILLLAAPVKAQETTTEETTVLAADAADKKVEAETSNTSVEVDNGKVSVSTDDGSSSDDGTSQQSSMTVQQNQTDEGSGSRASTGDVNVNQQITTEARTNLNGKTARIQGPNSDKVDRVVISGLNSCERSGGSVRVSVRQSDNDGSTTANFTDGSNTFIQVNSSQVVITPNNGNFLNVPSGFNRGNGTVTSSSGIRCGNNNNNNNNNRNRHHNRHHDRNRHHRHHDRDRHNNRFFGRGAANQQYRSERIVEERVIRETIPNKGTLANTGGVPLTGAAFLALASVGLGVSILRFAVRRDQ